MPDADQRYTMPIRMVTEFAWHNLFVKQLFRRATPEQLKSHVPEWTVLNACRFLADPKKHKLNSEVFIIVDFSRKTVLIGGTQYAGEMKKSIFSVLNFVLPQQGVLPMHCSANVGNAGDVALFFGLSGTGKTTLSADPSRGLIGDDEHGWSDQGVFNFEGGCYAKCIKLTKEREPLIWDAIRFGSVIENVVVNPETREPNYFDDSITENTRCAYPLDFISNAVPGGTAGHPKAIILLAADAFGVLPPVVRLNPAQAMYHFMSGYTASLAGTEANTGKDPAPTFSACFGAPFLPLPPQIYAEMLADKMKKHGVRCYLLNTGMGRRSIRPRPGSPVAKSAYRDTDSRRHARRCQIPHGFHLQVRGAESAAGNTAGVACAALRRKGSRRLRQTSERSRRKVCQELRAIQGRFRGDRGLAAARSDGAGSAASALLQHLRRLFLPASC